METKPDAHIIGCSLLDPGEKTSDVYLLTKDPPGKLVLRFESAVLIALRQKIDNLPSRISNSHLTDDLRHENP